MTVTAETAVRPSTLVGGRPRAPRRRSLTPRSSLLAFAAYVIALIFLLPYIEMVLSALRPHAELLSPGYLPKRFDWSNFTTIWQTGFRANLAASLEIAGGATALVLIVAMPAAYYTARHRFRGRLVFLLLVLATQMFQPGASMPGNSGSNPFKLLPLNLGPWVNVRYFMSGDHVM